MTKFVDNSIDSETTITLNDLYSELSEIRESSRTYRVRYTEEQEAFIIKCRNNMKPITFRVMAILWKKVGWGNISEDSLRRQWAKMVDNGNYKNGTIDKLNSEESSIVRSFKKV